MTVPDGIHQAGAAETARLTAELATAHAALDDRASRRSSLDTLGRFLAEGTELHLRIADGSFGALTAQVEDWIARLSAYVRDTRGAGGLAQLQSDAGLRPMVLTDPPAPDGIGRRIVTGERGATWAVVYNRCTWLQEFLAEDARA